MVFTRAMSLALILGAGGSGVVEVAAPAPEAAAPQVGSGPVEGACGAAPVVSASSRPNIFSEEQEKWLGEAMADMAEGDYAAARDQAQSAHLQMIVDRLAATLPNTHIPFKVLIIDSPEVNAFSLAGGHIYMFQKLAAAAQNDDELAAVLGHEMGHIASHQFAFETTRDLKRLLGITSVGDRADVYAKFQKLMEARWKDQHPSNPDSDDKQDEADKIGVYVAAAAGYRPQAFGEFWDRVFFTQGKTGNRFLDVFGLTKPDQRRLRGIQKLASELPPGCGAKESVVTPEFVAWHRSVVANKAVAAKVALNSTEDVVLSPRLRMDIDRLRFSPDGKMLLAQDEGSVYVISRDSTTVKFRIDAPDALPAQFSPDSSKIVFESRGLHTEEWSVADGKQLSVREPISPRECLQTRLSPDGRTILCISVDAGVHGFDMTLLDAETAKVIVEQRPFFQPNWIYGLWMDRMQTAEQLEAIMPATFSEDGNFVLFGPGRVKEGVDLRTRTIVPVGNGLLTDVATTYAFAGNDRVIGVNPLNPGDSGVFSFPQGKLLQRMELHIPELQSVSHSSGDLYVTTTGISDGATGLADLTTGKILVKTKTGPIDLWGNTLTAENADGSVLLGKMGTTGVVDIRKVVLPESPLGTLQAVATSPDGRYIALSTHNHGGIWDLTTGKEELATRGFEGARFTDNDTVYVEYVRVTKDVVKEKKEQMAKEPREIVRISIPTKKVEPVGYAADEETHMRYDRLVEWKQEGGKRVSMSIHALDDGKVLWSRELDSDLTHYTVSAGGKDLIFSHHLNADVAKERLRARPELAAEAARVKDKDDGRVVQVVNVETGEVEAEAVIEVQPSFSGIDGFDRAGDLLYIATNDNRTEEYSLRDGKEVRQTFGRLYAADPETARACLVNRHDEVFVVDAEGKELLHVHTGSSVRYVGFKEDGTELLVMTADQKVHTLEVGKEKAVSATVVAPAK